MSDFVTLRVDTGPSGIMSLTIPGATTLRYTALRFADELGLDTDQNNYFLMEPGTFRQFPRDSLAVDYNGALFILGTEPFNN